MTNPRKAAVQILIKIEKDNAYSNITLKSYLTETELSREDKAFISALVYGVLDRKITLDYVLAKFIKTPLKKVAPFTVYVLRTALYQIMFMDKVPESAAVNEAVKLIKKSRESRNSSFVNGVLRAILREEAILPQGDSINDLSVRYSCPLWIVESFLKDYGFENTLSLLEECLKPAPTVLRVNTLKISAAELKQKLLEMGIETAFGDIENSLLLSKGIDIGNNSLFKEGFFHVQDLASQRAVSVLCPKQEERVLDLCASPGGKSFTMAEYMDNKGEIVSCDLYEQRVKLIADGAKRLSLNIIKPTVSDATVFNENLGKFDCILCDVPCSGLGVIRRKPDIKYKPQEDFKALEEIQLKILKNSVKYLKPKGRILYSTCTLRREENEKLVISFLKEYNSFKLVEEATLMPHLNGTDGFYYALIESNE